MEIVFDWDKKCVRCGEIKIGENFELLKTTKAGKAIRRNICKPCRYVEKIPSQNTWYRENKEKVIAEAAVRRKEWRKRNREFVQEIKFDSVCADCGVNYPYYVLQFDHVRGVKIGTIQDLSNRPTTTEKIKAEIEKCELVCSNCHAERTHQRRLILKEEEIRV